MYKSYLKTYFSICIISILVVFCTLPFLYKNYELSSLEEIAKIQKNNHSLYLSGVHNNFLQYKLSIYKSIRPKVVVMGTSALNSVRQNFFNANLANLSNTVYSIEDSLLFLNKLLEIHTPEIVIFGLDYDKHLFFDPFILYFKKLEQEDTKNLTLKKLILPLQWLYDNKITSNQFIEDSSPFQLMNKEFLGLNAHYFHSGFGPDGSYYHQGEFQQKPNIQPDRSDLFGKTEYVSLGKIPPQSIIILKAFINKLEENKIHLILLLTAKNNFIFTEVGKINYLKDIENSKSYLDKHQINYFSANDISQTVYDFYDQTHAGDLYFARLFLHFSKKDYILANYLNLKYLNHVTSSFKDITKIPDN